MRLPWLIALLITALGLGAVGVATSRAQQPAAPPRANLSIMVRGAQRALTDSVKGIMLEYDPPRQMDLLIVGAKGKGQFTCEVRSTSRELLATIQRTLLEAPDVSVTCANGTPSMRGGVIVDLDDPKTGGSFVFGVQRPG